MRAIRLLAASVIVSGVACSSLHTDMEGCTATIELLETPPHDLSVFNVRIDGVAQNSLRVVPPVFEMLHSTEDAPPSITNRELGPGERSWMMDKSRANLFAAMNRIAATDEDGVLVFELKPGWFQVRLSYVRRLKGSGRRDVCVATSAPARLRDIRRWQVEDDPF